MASPAALMLARVKPRRRGQERRSGEGCGSAPGGAKGLIPTSAVGHRAFIPMMLNTKWPLKISTLQWPCILPTAHGVIDEGALTLPRHCCRPFTAKSEDPNNNAGHGRILP
jgi:hypothetical protein